MTCAWRACVRAWAQVLGRMQRMREYYVEQRRLQVAADLAAPHVPFLENYQAYLGQVRACLLACVAGVCGVLGVASSLLGHLFWGGGQCIPALGAVVRFFAIARVCAAGGVGTA